MDFCTGNVGSQRQVGLTQPPVPHNWAGAAAFSLACGTYVLLPASRLLPSSFHKFGGGYFPGTGDIGNMGHGACASWEAAVLSGGGAGWQCVCGGGVQWDGGRRASPSWERPGFRDLKFLLSCTLHKQTTPPTYPPTHHHPQARARCTRSTCRCVTASQVRGPALRACWAAGCLALTAPLYIRPKQLADARTCDPVP